MFPKRWHSRDQGFGTGRYNYSRHFRHGPKRPAWLAGRNLHLGTNSQLGIDPNKLILRTKHWTFCLQKNCQINDNNRVMLCLWKIKERLRYLNQYLAFISYFYTSDLIPTVKDTVQKNIVQHWNFAGLNFQTNQALTERLIRESALV